MKSRGAAFALVALGLVLAAGAARLTVDEGVPHALPGDHPLVELNERLRATTGGDDLLGIVLHHPDGLLNPEGVAAIEEVREALAMRPSLERVRAATGVPLLEVDGETVTAVRPLRPPPEDEAGWAAARERVLREPFLIGSLLSPDGTTALVMGWIRRQDAEAGFVDRVTTSLKDAEFRGGEVGAELQKIVQSTRMAVALGEADGPIGAALGARLTAASGSGGPLGAHLAAELEAARAAAADPEGAAAADVEAVLAGLPPRAGLERLPTGGVVFQRAVRALYPGQLAAGFVGVFTVLLGALLLAGLGPGPALVRLGLAGVLLGATAGAMGWAGVAVSPPVATALLCASGACALAVLPGEGIRAEFALLPVVAVVGADRWASLVLGLLFVALALRSLRAGSPATTGVGPLRGLGWVGAATALGAMLLATQAPGVRVDRWLPKSEPAGRAAALSADRMGVAAPAYLVLDGGEHAVTTDPEALRALAAADDALRAEPAVADSVGWVDFVQGLHRAVAGAPEGELPERSELVEQYLLLFGQPEETRPLAAPDGTLALQMVRIRPERSAELARLVRERPAGTGAPALAGEGAALSLGAADAVRSGAASAGVLLLVALAILAVLGAPRAALKAAAIAVPSGLLAAGAAALASGAVTHEALAAGTLVSGAGCALAGASRDGRTAGAAILGLGTAALVPGPLVPLSGLGIGLLCGSVALWGLCAVLADPAQAPTRSSEEDRGPRSPLRAAT